MMKGAAWSLALAAFTGVDARAQTPATATDIVSAARVGAEVYLDRRAAIGSGYRRLGMDFPSMGEHWVNPGRLLGGAFDAARPAILSYVNVAGEPKLAGVVYAIPLRPGETPPRLPAGAGIWHEHSGSVEEESLSPEHLHREFHGAHASHGAAGAAGRETEEATRTRLVILHVWTHAVNPAGAFDAENWALPFLRLGLRVPGQFSEKAARTLSLLTGGSDYFAALAESRSGSGAVVRAILERYHQKAARIVQQSKGAGVLTATEIASLERIWHQAVDEVARGTSSVVASAMAGNG